MLKATYTAKEAQRMAEALDEIHDHLVISPQRRMHGRVFIDQLHPICDEAVLKALVKTVKEQNP